jgi:Fe-S-cluster containining protein
MGVLQAKVESHVKLVRAVNDFIYGKGGLPDFGKGRFEHQAYKYALVVDVLYGTVDSIIESAKEVMAGKGTPVTCSSGCSACCYQPVGVSFPEVFLIAEYLNMRPDAKERFLKKYSDWRERIDFKAYEAHMNDLQARIMLARSMEPAVDGVGSAVDVFYRGAPVACPFLEKESCDIYPARPLNCRQMLTVSDSKNCKTGAGLMLGIEGLDAFATLRFAPAMMHIFGDLGIDDYVTANVPVIVNEFLVNGKKYIDFYASNLRQRRNLYK